jgi:hypothetical protein
MGSREEVQWTNRPFEHSICSEVVGPRYPDSDVTQIRLPEAAISMDIIRTRQNQDCRLIRTCAILRSKEDNLWELNTMQALGLCVSIFNITANRYCLCIIAFAT